MNLQHTLNYIHLILQSDYLAWSLLSCGDPDKPKNNNWENKAQTNAV